MMSAGDFLLVCCAVLYGGLAFFIALSSRRIASYLLALSCFVTAAWAMIAFQVPAFPAAQGLDGTGLDRTGLGGADLARAVAWFWFLFHLYRRAGLGRTMHQIGFATAGVGAAGLGLIGVWFAPALPGPVSVFTWGIAARLGLGVTELLLIENLYLNMPEHARWHVALPSVLLGGLACFDILLCADLVLFQQSSPALVGGRTLAMIIIAPLLAVAGARGQRWPGKVKLSRSAVFHSATLLLSGAMLLALGVSGAVFGQLGPNWGLLAEISLAFMSLIATAILVTSGSARSRFQRLVVDHFFAERYDYRRQWQACIRTLSGDDDDGAGTLPSRAVRAIASVVDSPAGLLFLRDGTTGPFDWTGSWNMPAVQGLAADHPVVSAVRNGSWIAQLDTVEVGASAGVPFEAVGPLWLAVPLLHRGALTGLVVVAGPRAPFELEQEVFDLLRIVALEVATFIAEQKAMQTLVQNRALHDYGQRFAFVAHDIKNVSSQLGLLLSNAESHLANPAFQRDMLETVRSSVRKTTALLQRLEQPAGEAERGALVPCARLERLIADYRRERKVELRLEHDGLAGTVPMEAEAFETAVTHLLNNAVEAGGAAAVQLRHEAGHVVVDIVDRGPGMTPEFIRDRLFTPFNTSKAGGSGIGAYQARELLRVAGGELAVISKLGGGTTMQIVLPRLDVHSPEVSVMRVKACSGVGA